MSGGLIGRERAQYRRGLVLGFTVAETLLLVLFALMLALGFVLLKRERELRTLSGEITALRERGAFLTAKVDVLDAMVKNRPTDAFFRELVRARALESAVAARAARLTEREKADDEARTLLAAVHGSPDQKRRVQELAALGAQVQAQVERASAAGAARGAAAPKPGDTFALVPQAVALAQASLAGGQPVDAARRRLADAAAGARENATLQGQVVSLRRDLDSVGRGGDYPPCWVTAEGQIQFLMKVTLGANDSLSAEDTTPPPRAQDRRALPLAPGLFGRRLSRAAFLAGTQALYDQSRARGCRHYVMIADRTGPTQKDLFKTLLFTVEAHFYKVILR